jgi:predicted glycoside hydrolase/deacetylase ChbG (UPF0249 family)/glycosyltransferase involved in cell wall biosynthesis
MQKALLLPSPRRLIINADDLGVSAARDAGILDCFAAGAISSASLLVDGANAATAAAAATAAGLPLGLHLNLTEGPLSAARSFVDLATNSLTDPNGKGLGKFGLRAALTAGRVTRKDIAGEIRRQFERFIALTGELPSHVDGHNHIHVEAQIAEVLAPIMAREYGVYCVRLPREAGLEDRTGDAEYEADFQRSVTRSALAIEGVFAAAGIYSTGAFLGQSSMGIRLTAGGVAAQLAALTGYDAVELMVHPGRRTDDPELGPFCRSPGRAHEAEQLQSAEFAAARAGWTLTSYRELRRPQADGRPSLLLYGKLTPGTGNAETARRYAAAWAAQAHVRFRPLPIDESPARLAREVARLQEMAHRERLDLAVGIHLLRAGRPLAAAFAGDAAAPLAYGLLASGTDANADIAVPDRRAAMHEAVGHADFVLCLTGDLRQRLDPLPLPADCTVLPNGIDVRGESSYSLRAELGLSAETPIALLPSALRRIKGPLPTAEALALLLAQHFTDHVLLLLGPTLEEDYADRLRQRIDELTAAYPGLAGRIVLHPGLPREDYLAALREVDVVINASDHEGLSHALAEAMATGIPVLARDIPGNRALVRDGDNGRLFADFSDLPRAYAACFDEAAATRAMTEAARGEIAVRYPPAAEEDALRAVLSRSLARRQVQVGALRLDLAAGTHPVSAENQALFAQIAQTGISPEVPTDIALAADIGCGCGVFGIHLLAAAKQSGRHVQRLLCADPHRASLVALERSLLRHAGQSPLPESVTLDDGSLLEPLLRNSERATLICANLPQTPGPVGFRLDRCGGDDGAELICAFLADLPRALTDDGETFLLHIGLAHPARVAATIAAIGFTATEIAAQTRHAHLADYETLQPGLAAWLLAERAAGRAEFVPDSGGGDGFTFRARLLRLRRAPV